MGEIQFYQILFALICLIFLAKGFSHLFRRDRTIREFIAVLFFWGGLLIFSIFPDYFSKLAFWLGFRDYVNAILVSCILLLFYIVFMLIRQIDQNEKKLTELVRKLSLEKHFRDEESKRKK